MIKNILIPLDGSEHSKAALDYAIWLARGFDACRMAGMGALIGLPAFACVIFSAPLQAPLMFQTGAMLVGLGGGFFSVGMLVCAMNMAQGDEAGLVLGAWGAVQATAAGLAMGLGGIIRDLMAVVVDSGTAYAFVYSLEVVLLLITLYAMYPLIAKKVR